MRREAQPQRVRGRTRLARPKCGGPMQRSWLRAEEMPLPPSAGGKGSPSRPGAGCKRSLGRELQAWSKGAS